MKRRVDPAQSALFDEPAPEVPGGDFIPLAEQFDALPADWKALLTPCIAQTNWPALCAFVDGERAAGKPIFPTDVFCALHLTSVDDVRVVILGQDPYHGTGTVDGREIAQAHGLAFSVPAGVRVPPSLRNIYKEIEAEFGQKLPSASGNLEGWSQQGVLLLNTVLTVEAGQAASHAGWGWEALTDALVTAAATDAAPKVAMLWGAHAQRKAALMQQARQASGAALADVLLLQSNHPSPLSATRGPVPFVGNGHFGQARAFWAGRGVDLDWSLPAVSPVTLASDPQ